MPKVVVTAAKGLHQVAGNGSIEGHRRAIKNVAASTALSVDDSGKLIVIAAHSVTITLPTSSGNAGVQYDFIVGASLSSGASVVRTFTADGSQQFNGGYIGGDNTSANEAAGSNEDKITFGTSAALGSRVSVVCDGTDWFITSGYADAIANVAFST